MLERLLGTETFITAQGALDGLAERQSTIADNISNVNTAGYKRKYVSFEDTLQSEVQRTISPITGASMAPFDRFKPPVSTDSQTTGRMDGNNVDIDREMALISEGAIKFRTITQYISGYFSGLKSVINSGR